MENEELVYIPRYYYTRPFYEEEKKVEKDVILEKFKKGEIDVDKAVELLKDNYGVI